MVALHFTLFASCIARRTFGDRKKDKTLAGDGSEGAQDGTEKSCSFVQVHGICSVSDTLFTTDAAAGKIKLMTGLSGTTDFLKHLGILNDTFGITCKASTPQPITPESEHSRLVHQSYGNKCQRKKQPQGGLNNEWSSRNSVPEDTNLYRASTEWCEEPYEQSHNC